MTAFAEIAGDAIAAALVDSRNGMFADVNQQAMIARLSGLSPRL
jgi:hypothetical protein